MFQDMLIAAVVLFVNRHTGAQTEVTTTYPLVVPLGVARPDIPPVDALARAYNQFWYHPAGR